ncbi:MAG: hypothetical protein EZS28_036792, partial [Streblomastix strix]
YFQSPSQFFLSTLIVTVLLLISSILFLVSNAVLSGIIETLKFESECDATNYDTSVCKTLNIIQVVIILFLVKFRRAITISHFGESIALVAFDVLTFTYAVYMMAVIFHGFVVIAFHVLYVGISIKGFGIVGIIGNYDFTKVNRILLFVIRCTYFITGVTMFAMAIMGLVMNETTNYVIQSQSCFEYLNLKLQTSQQSNAEAITLLICTIYTREELETQVHGLIAYYRNYHKTQNIYKYAQLSNASIFLRFVLYCETKESGRGSGEVDAEGGTESELQSLAEKL